MVGLSCLARKKWEWEYEEDKVRFSQKKAGSKEKKEAKQIESP